MSRYSRKPKIRIPGWLAAVLTTALVAIIVLLLGAAGCFGPAHMT